MSEPYLGEIRMFGGNYAPKNWAYCNGQTLNINDNPDLYSLIGTTYGGDAKTTFALPDFRGRIPVHYGQGTGLSHYHLGEKKGTEKVSIPLDSLPSHKHKMCHRAILANKLEPSNKTIAYSDTIDTPLESRVNIYKEYPEDLKHMNAKAITNAGVNEPHDNMQPYLCISFIICIKGTVPPRP